MTDECVPQSPMEAFLEALDDWTIYREERDAMPYVVFKPNSPSNNILVQAGCFDNEDLETYFKKGFWVLSSRQVNLLRSFIEQVGLERL